MNEEDLRGSDSGGRNRRRILDVVARQPGLCLRTLARATGIPAGTVRHHIPVLERCGLLTRIRHGQEVLHFPGAKPPSMGQVRAAVLRDLDGAWRVVYHVAATHAGWCQKQVLDALPEQSRSTVLQHRLRRLVEVGLLEQRPVGLQGVAYGPVGSLHRGPSVGGGAGGMGAPQ